jgi:hypothetical protein
MTINSTGIDKLHCTRPSEVRLNLPFRRCCILLLLQCLSDLSPAHSCHGACHLISYHDPERLLHFSVLLTPLTIELEETSVAEKLPLPEMFVLRRPRKKIFVLVNRTPIWKCSSWAFGNCLNPKNNCRTVCGNAEG